MVIFVAVIVLLVVIIFVEVFVIIIIFVVTIVVNSSDEDDFRSSYHELGEFVVSVGNEALLGAEGADDVAQGGERLVNGIGFFELLRRRPSLRHALRPRQIHQR